MRRPIPVLLAVTLLLVACGADEPAPDADGRPSPPATSPATGPSEDGPSPEPEPAGSGPAPASSDATALRVTTEEVVAGLVAPVQTLVVEGGTMVVQQDGRVVELADGGVREWLDLSDRVAFGGERGLLGVAVLPGGDHLVAHWSAAADGATTLATLPLVDGEPAGEPTVVLEVDQPASNHNGGSVLVAPDGAVLLGLGDGGGAGDRFRNGQDPGSLLGTVLRIDLSDPSTAGVPADNPYVDGGAGAPLVWLHGLRNPYRMAIGDGQLYVGDVGQDAVEEITVVPLEPTARNLGWPIVEGDRCFAVDPCDDPSLEPADVTYDHADTGGCSVITGLVYEGDALPALRGHLLYGDLCAGFLRTVRAEGGQVVDELDLTDQVGDAAGLLSVGPDADGEALLTFADGRVVRLVPAG